MPKILIECGACDKFHELDLMTFKDVQKGYTHYAVCPTTNRTIVKAELNYAEERESKSAASRATHDAHKKVVAVNSEALQVLLTDLGNKIKRKADAEAHLALSKAAGAVYDELSGIVPGADTEKMVEGSREKIEEFYFKRRLERLLCELLALTDEKCSGNSQPG